MKTALIVRKKFMFKVLFDIEQVLEIFRRIVCIQVLILSNVNLTAFDISPCLSDIFPNTSNLFSSIEKLITGLNCYCILLLTLILFRKKSVSLMKR